MSCVHVRVIRACAVLTHTRSSPLRCIAVSIIDRAAIVAGTPHLARKRIEVADLSSTAKECLRRATLEAERRLAGNTSEELTGAWTELTDDECVAICLDPRTSCQLDGQVAMSRVFGLFETALLEHTITVEKYLAAEEKDRAAQAAATVAAARKSALDLPPACESSTAAAPAPAAPARSAWDFLPSPPRPTAQAPVEVDDEARWGSRRQELLPIARACCTRWLKRQWDWPKLYPAELDAFVPRPAPAPPPLKLDLIRDLMKLPIGTLFKRIIDEPNSFAQYGYIPHMAGCSKYQLASLNSESFCERTFSEVNNTMTSGNTLLADKELAMLTILRINRDFIRYMRQTYPSIAAAPAKRAQAAHSQHTLADDDSADGDDDDGRGGLNIQVEDEPEGSPSESE